MAVARQCERLNFMNTNALQLYVIVILTMMMKRSTSPLDAFASTQLTGLEEKMSALSKYHPRFPPGADGRPRVAVCHAR